MKTQINPDNSFWPANTSGYRKKTFTNNKKLFGKKKTNHYYMIIFVKFYHFAVILAN